jgi:DNA-binding transcriptional MerR regulator
VRALRVYERHGLIDPARSSKGWRCYGPRELQRLNVIVTLKAFGMTLAQIRALLATKTPPIELINEQITPDEERAYMIWMAARPAGEVKAMQEYGAAVPQVR